MRILQIVHDFLPRHVAGTERYTHDLSQALSEDMRVLILCGEYDADCKPYTHCGDIYNGLRVSRIFLPEKREFVQTYHNPILDPVFREVLGEFSPDIIHIQHLSNLSVSLIDVAGRMNVPVIMTLHDYWTMCPAGQLVKREWGPSASSPGVDLCPAPTPEGCLKCMSPPLFHILSRKLRRNIDSPAELKASLRRVKRIFGRGLKSRVRNVFGPLKARVKGARHLYGKDMEKRERTISEAMGKISLFISPSAFLRDRFVEWGLSSEKIIRLENGTDTRPFREFSERRGKNHLDNSRDDDPVEHLVEFGFVGTVKPHKAPHLPIEALAALKNPGMAKVVIYGDTDVDPNYTAHLRRLTRDRNVEFAGRFEERNKPSIYHGMDALVVPSVWHENSPVTIHEAFASKTPVIASDIGGIGELVEHEGNGLLFKAGSVGELSSAMGRFVESPELRRRLRKNIPEVKGMEEHKREIMEIYGKVVGESS